MTLVILGLLVVAIGLVVWRRTRQRPAMPAGPLASLVDQGRDLVAPLYPSQPLSRRALPRRLLRAAEQTITVGVSGTVLVPSRIEIAVNPADLEPFAEAMEWLRRDVAEALRQRARANDWVVPDGPEVVITPDEDRPVRLPRAVGRITAFSREDVGTRPWSGPPIDDDRGDAGPRRGAVGDSDSVREPAEVSTPVPPSGPATPQPEPTGATAAVVGSPDAHGLDEPTVASDPAIHVRLVAVEQSTGGEGDLNALLVASAPPLVLGRSREADLQVKDRQVSARHCVLSIDPDDPEGGTVLVRDLRSTNGTFVDGQRVEEATLTSGAELRLGRSSWRVEIDPVAAR